MHRWFIRRLAPSGSAAALAAAAALALGAGPAQAASRFSSAPTVGSTLSLPSTGSPYQEAYDPDTGLLYVAVVNGGAATTSGDIDVVYTADATQASTSDLYPGATTNQVVAQLPFGTGTPSLGASVPFGLTLNPGTGRLLTTSDANGTAYMFDVDPSSSDYDTVLASYDFSTPGDRSATVDELDDLFYLANPYAATVTVIDGQTNKILNTYSAKAGPSDNYTSDTTGVAYDPQTNLLYASNVDSFTPGTAGTVSVMNASTGAVLKQISVGSTPVDISFDSNSQRLFVADENYGTQQGSVSVIDTDPNSPTDNTVVATTSVGAAPIGTTVDESYGLVYVPDWGGDTVSVLDAYSGDLLWTLTVGNEPDTVQLDPFSHLAYVDNLEDDTVSVITPPSAPMAIVHSQTSLAVSPSASGFAGSPVTLSATVSNGSTGAVQFYDDGSLLGQAAVSGGIATLTTSSLAVGTHTLQVAYTSSDDQVDSSYSGPVHYQVESPGEQGTTGSPGAPGATGARGAKGAKGAKAHAWKITVSCKLVNRRRAVRCSVKEKQAKKAKGKKAKQARLKVSLRVPSAKLAATRAGTGAVTVTAHAKRALRRPRVRVTVSVGSDTASGSVRTGVRAATFTPRPAVRRTHLKAPARH